MTKTPRGRGSTRLERIPRTQRPTSPPVDAPSSKGPHPAAPRSRTDRPRLIAPPQDAAPAWGELMERLTLFEQLVADGATTQAAVVADDIEDRLNHFDPRDIFRRCSPDITLPSPTT
ncbi:MAG: hypothetical protein IPN01_22035 [Deltaproteobacteria bacterium]|nr:hypothetical protein [Deltaproteobacteria bacterium]